MQLLHVPLSKQRFCSKLTFRFIAQSLNFLRIEAWTIYAVLTTGVYCVNFAVAKILKRYLLVGEYFYTDRMVCVLQSFCVACVVVYIYGNMLALH